MTAAALFFRGNFSPEVEEIICDPRERVVKDSMPSTDADPVTVESKCQRVRVPSHQAPIVKEPNDLWFIG